MCNAVCPRLFCELTSARLLGDLAISSCIRGKWPFWLEMWSAVLPVLGSCHIPPRPARDRCECEYTGAGGATTIPVTARHCSADGAGAPAGAACVGRDTSDVLHMEQHPRRVVS